MQGCLGKGQINQLLFADDTVLVADFLKLCTLVNGCGRACE